MGPGRETSTQLKIVPAFYRYLVQIGDHDAACTSIQYYFKCSQNKANTYLYEIKEEQKQNTRRFTMMDVVKKRSLRSKAIIGVVVTFAMSFSGVAVINAYAFEILKDTGLSVLEASFANVGIAIVSMIGCMVASLVIDKFGRRPMLLVAFTGILFCNIVIVALMYTFDSYGYHVLGFLLIFFICVFIVFFAIGPGPLSFFINAELVGQAARSASQSWASVVQMLSRFALVTAFLPMKNQIGEAWAYAILFIVPVAVSIIYLYFSLPETKNKDAKQVAEAINNLPRFPLCRKDKIDTEMETFDDYDKFQTNVTRTDRYGTFNSYDDILKGVKFVVSALLGVVFPGKLRLTVCCAGAQIFKTTKYDKDDEQPKTLWKLVVITGIVSFLTSIENTVLGVSEWPYLQLNDHKATADFFGVASACARGAHAVFSLLFSFWSFKFKAIKLPLITGRIVCIVSCLLYIFAPEFPNNRRYAYLTCYILFSIGSSAATILRAYVVAISTPTDRPRAIAATSLANILSIVIGPTVQLAFSAIPYPGAHVFSHVYLNVFTAPVWFAFFVNFVTFPFIIWGLRTIDQPHDDKEDESVFTWHGLKRKLRQVQDANFDWIIVVLCWFMKISLTFSASIFLSLMSIMVMVQYGWAGTKTVRVLSGTLGGVGILASFILIGYMLLKRAKVLPQRYIFLCSLLLSVAVFWITHPWKGISEPVAQFNETTLSGCSPKQYHWCDTAYAVHPVMLLVSLVVIYGIGYPCGTVALDTIYSKVLGPIDQNLMQGALIVADDVSNIFTPIYATNMFTKFGISTLWYANGGVFIVVTIIWIVFLPRLKRFP
ncbi:unnamed protein product [Caenorhabditis auriculariae]|uniref:Major facilitator superfamily (MFS) profile domain-containing protein n=1 Tax=Caenorhabditis auriculariae TaxID=2777116 RepID=A0A8S1HJR1_9PELO|nr:unnamed protein product [Caenorhabditis auriculariae]